MSECVTLAQAENIIAAAKHAVAIGRPLNRHVTIHWGLAGIADEDACAAIGRFVKLATDWLAGRGGSAWLWVREYGMGKGSHVHLLLHVPAGVALRQMTRRWVMRASAKPYVACAVRTRAVGGTAAACTGNPSHYRENLEAVCAYVLKGIEPGAAAMLGLTKLEAGGRIIGKRCGMSQNLNRAARAVK